MSLVNWNSINGASQEYHQAKNNLERIDKYISKTIEDNTVNELNALKKATENYNKKIESILESSQMKKIENEAKKNYETIKKSIKIAFETYKKVKQIIYDKKDLTLEEKKEYEKKLYQKLMDKFMTDEEKKIFEKIMTMQNENIIVLSPKTIMY